MAGLVIARRGLPGLRQFVNFTQYGQARVARAIHAFMLPQASSDADARDKRGHDAGNADKFEI